MIPQMHLYILGSGSKGNAAIIEGPTGSVLLDCGLSRKRLLERADEAGCDVSRIQAILVTHEHGDHTAGLPVVSNHFDGPIYATAGTASGRKSLLGIGFDLIRNDEVLKVCGMRITAFSTSHDVNDPTCFRFEVFGDDGELLDAIGWATDTGYLTDGAYDALYNCRILGIEANHDPHMLKNGPYPAWLKARIASNQGHLSNSQAAEALPALTTSNTEVIVALHISEENNRPSLAIRALAQALDAECADSTFTEARTPDGLLSICAAAQNRTLALW